MDDIDRVLLNRIQEDLPLVSRPYAALGELVGVSEDEALARLRRLKEERLIRQISAIFDTRALGYQSTLVAARVAPERVEEAAEVINRHPGVSHNYLRDHSFNVWFTIALPPGTDLSGGVDALCRMADAEHWRLLPALKMFKIRAQFDVAGERALGDRDGGDGGDGGGGAIAAADSLPPITAGDIAVIRALQEDFPLVPEPYRFLAGQAGLDEATLLERAGELRRQGRLRRLAAVLHHRRAGFVANGMIVWEVPAERAEQVGRLFSAYRTVTHCYLRPSYPDWPFNIFTMVHGRNGEECEEMAALLSRESGVTNYTILYSLREFKKTRVRYFAAELDRWEAVPSVR